MPAEYEIVIPSKYISGGKEKTKWVKIGCVFRANNGGLTGKFDSMPMPPWNGFFNMFKPRGTKGTSSEAATTAEEMQPMDDVPM